MKTKVKKKMSRKKKIIITFLLLLLLAAAAAGVYVYYIFNSLTTEELDVEKLGVNKELNDKVINIALFGLDGRDDEDVEGDRADTIMIGTLDTRDNSVKVTSVMRDTFVKICVPDGETEETVKNFAGDSDGIEWDINELQTQTAEADDSTREIEVDQNQIDEETLSYADEYSQLAMTQPAPERVTVEEENKTWVAQYDKINAAYYVGQAQASIKTLNENFDLNIQDYISVDFNCLMEIVDVLGGIEIDIPTEDVMKWTNEYLKESNGYGKRNDPELTHTGVQTLTGAQALAFARNRYSDSDYGRTQRQREVIQGIFNKATKMDALTALNLVNKIYPYVKTSLSLNEITEYASVILDSKNMNFEGYRIPTNTFGTSGFSNNDIWYLFPDTLVDNCRALHAFIYGKDQTYTPSYTVRQISQVIDDYMNYSSYGLTTNVGGMEEEKIVDSSAETENGDTIDSEETVEETVGASSAPNQAVSEAAVKSDSTNKTDNVGSTESESSLIADKADKIEEDSKLADLVPESNLSSELGPLQTLAPEVENVNNSESDLSSLETNDLETNSVFEQTTNSE